VNVKDAYATLQKTIKWLKKFGKRRHEWEKALYWMWDAISKA
jgi:hypothetical protein